MKLHGTVGPSRTTISAIASEAGVQRATVYRHFPEDEALFDACTAHFYGLHPRPDLERWGAIRDPTSASATRSATSTRGTSEVEQMLSNTQRDAAGCRPRLGGATPTTSKRPPPPCFSATASGGARELAWRPLSGMRSALPPGVLSFVNRPSTKRTRSS